MIPIAEVEEDERTTFTLKDLKPGDIWKAGDGNDDGFDYASFYVFLECGSEPYGNHLAFRLSDLRIVKLPYDYRGIWSIIKYKPIGTWKVERQV